MIEVGNRLFFAEVETQLAEGHDVQIRIKGHSMRPLLRDGHDSVILSPPDISQLREGDIVLFRCSGRHILHRIVKCDGNRFTLAGDGNYRITERCTANDVAAIATAVIRSSGRIVRFGSRRWKWLSHSWLAIPQVVRRQILRVLWHLGYK